MCDYSYYITPEEYAEAERNGISAKVLDDRIRAYGWDHKRAITEPARGRNMEMSKWYRLAENNGIRPNTFHNRLKLGWSLEKASSTPPICKTERNRLANEARKKYSDKLLETATKNGICYTTLLNRINRDGMDPLEAATMPLRPKGRKKLLRNRPK